VSSGPASQRQPANDVDRARFWRAATGLALAGASLGMALALLRPGLSAFVLSNAVSAAGRQAILIGVLAGGALGWLLSLALSRRAGGLDRLGVLARLAAPFALIGLVPPFFSRGGWGDDLAFSISLAVLVLALERLVRLQATAWPAADEIPGLAAWRAAAGRVAGRIPPRLRAWAPAAAVALAAVAYAAYVIFFTIRNHRHFNTWDYDLGQLDNQFWNALHGHPFRCTPLIRGGNWSELRNHAEFAVFALLPFYALAPRAETLLVLQALIVASAAIPIYRFAARRLARGWAVALAFAYLLYPPLQAAVFFDFHFQPIAAAFILWMIDAFDEQRQARFLVFFALALACREDISIDLACFGLYLVLVGRRVRAGILIVEVAVTYFIVMRFVLMPLAGSWGFAELYRGLYPPGELGFGSVVKTMLTNPVFTFRTLLTGDKLRYLLQILTPVAFLPLRRSPLWLAVVPGLYFTVLTTGYAPATQISYQYCGHFVAFIFPAAALALHAYGRSADGAARRTAAAVALMAATLIATARWGGVPPHAGFASGYGTVRFGPVTPAEQDKARWLRELAAEVPADAKLAVSNRELPHLSNRLDCYGLMEGYEGSDAILYVPGAGGLDEQEATRALASGRYLEIDRRPGLSLLELRGAP
jgi:uncharacterized membrane protein